ncbi:serine/threonine-protein kinase [Luteimonas saliphila]|uniref:serine/threonine-protein kinase n=1 Tax=Luteimonas saliphila TaxID=2804919 RepID=UPI00192D96C4|nr:serine/threonine-protein kinase [Luteimonas saliphila]
MDARDKAAWREADRILDQLLDLAPEHRAAALEATAPDPALRAMVERLLAAHGNATGPLECAPNLDSLDPREGGSLAGKRLGRWRLVEEIGRGGMAAVYRATSEEVPVGQLAAVKVLTLGALAAGGHDRFLREQQLLARLRHPGIVPLYEGGVAEDGTPWLAMALVDGERIDAWCNDRGADLETRVGLLLQIAGALAYAHRNLVIHRDIKPSNVLVDEDGHVRLLDFGIARLADELEPERTATALRALTPQYAAPEQFAGDAPGTAMDVYGLGALAYCLLAGQPPHGEGGRGTERPPPPSRARRMEDRREGAARAWARRLKGDLDTIAMKALAERPEDRYASIEAMADDLQRWRERRPIRARAPSLGYRLGRLIARRRAATAALLAVVVLGAVAAGQIAVQQHRAQEQAARASIVRDFLADVLASSDPSEGEIPDALDILETGARRAREELRTTSPLAAADVLSITGSARNALNDLDGAEADLLHALEILEGLPQPSPPELSRVHWSLGVLYKMRGTRRSLDHHLAAVEWVRKWDAPATERVKAEVSLASAWSRYGQMADAEQRLREVLAGIPEAGIEGTQEHMDALNALTSILARRNGPLEERIALHEQRTEVGRLLYGADNGWYAYTLADAVPTLRRDPAHLPRAEEMAREAVAITERIYEEPHMFAAVATCNLAALLAQSARMQEAAGYYSRAIGIDEALQRNDLHARSCRFGRAYVLASLGQADAARDDLARDRTMLSVMELERSGEWMNNCAMEALLQVAAGTSAAAAATLDDCRTQHAPADGGPIPLFELANAELHIAQDRPDLAAPILRALREVLPPGEPTRRWLRPWLLSVHVARETGDAPLEAQLRAQLRPHMADEAAGPCLDAGDVPRACPAFP